MRYNGFAAGNQNARQGEITMKEKIKQLRERLHQADAVIIGAGRT